MILGAYSKGVAAHTQSDVNRTKVNYIFHLPLAAFRVPIILVANMSEFGRAVPERRGQELALKWGVPFFRTSAKENKVSSCLCVYLFRS